MKKNLKKVISAVIALAMSLSTVAFAASKGFTDVDSAKSYYTAVTTLADLGIIAGYEDGSFKPDNKITRAEVTTMVVAAMNLTDEAKSMEGDTQFSDMTEATKWASGYVNCGVANKFIAGYDDGTFRPSANVQYAHIITMLVGALNYGEYATYMGGYPDGYIQIARTSGLTKGVAASAEDEVTRAQVATLIYNFLDTAKVEMNGMSWSSDGKLVPNIAIQDGTNDTVYKTILTDNWNVYILEGTVSATSKSDDSSALEADEIKFRIGKTKEKNNVNGYEDPSADEINTLGSEIIANVGDTDIADYLNTYGVAYAEYTDNDEWVIKHFEASGKNKSVKFAANLVDEEDYLIDNDNKTRDYVRFYPTATASKSTKYSLDDAVLYVNGRAIDGDSAISEADFEEFILNNNAGEVELIDTYESGSAADGYYDIINVTYYATARVDSVVPSSGRVAFKENSNNASSSITLDDEDEDLEFSITLDGAEIAVTDLKEDDILTIAYDASAGVEFRNSDFFEIMVSRNTAEGKYSGMTKSARTITLGDSKYELTELGVGADKEAQFVEKVETGLGMILSNEYKAYLDVFGRIFSVEVSKNVAKIGIVDKVVESNSYDNYALTLYTAEGGTKTYEVATSVKADKNGIEWSKVADARDVVYVNYAASKTNKTDLEDRVVEYKVNTKGYISQITLIEGVEAEGEYRSNLKAVGGVRMGAATTVVDATAYNRDQKISSLSKTTVDAMVVGTNYTVVGFGTKFNDSTYPYVLVLDGDGVYTEDTRLAVLTEGISTVVVDEEQLDAIVALTDESDDEVTIPVADDVIINGDPDAALDDLNLDKGDVVIFTKNAQGQIQDLDVVFAGSLYTSDSDDLKEAVLDADDEDHQGMLNIPAAATKWTGDWDGESSDTPVQLVMGPVVEKTSSSFSIGKVAEHGVYGLYTNLGALEDETAGIFNIAAVSGQTRVYTFDYDANPKSNLYVGGIGDIVKSGFVNADLEEDRTIIPWETLEGTDMCYVVAKVVNGLATDVFVMFNQ